ncbi:MAG: hypothetical protein HON04_15925 [Planctomicrobium sp.]|nr:hypothetical protein [Planctomicrobium sp.]
MNLRCIAQTAAILGRFGEKWERSRGSVDELAMTEFVKSSQVLFRIWSKRIQENRTEPENLLSLSQFAEEILVSELLTRTMAAELLVLGERTQQEEPTKIAFKFMKEHYRCREQLFELIEQRREGMSTLLRCQRLARKIERWSDLLISPFADSESAVHASFEEERCLDFGDQWYREKCSPETRGTFQVQLAALSISIPSQEITAQITLEAHTSRSQAALSFVSAESSMNSQGFQVSQLCNQVGNGVELSATGLPNSN